MSRKILIALATALVMLGYLARSRHRGPAAEATVDESPAAEQPPVRVAVALPTVPAAPPPPPVLVLEHMSDGLPIMPPGPEYPRPDTFAHPHPITPRHVRIFRENALLFQLNEAMDGKEPQRLRGLLDQYRDEYPEDPHDMQKGYALVADCLERPSEAIRVAARRYWREEGASTLRRFILRHCLADTEPGS